MAEEWMVVKAGFRRSYDLGRADALADRTESAYTAGRVHVDLSVRDARFAVEHLRFLVDRETPSTSEHAAAVLSARWLARHIEELLVTSGGQSDA